MKRRMFGLLAAVGIAGAAFAVIEHPSEVKFTFSDTPVAGLRANEVLWGQDVVIGGSCSSEGKDGGVTCVESLMGYGVHCYSPRCVIKCTSSHVNEYTT